MVKDRRERKGPQLLLRFEDGSDLRDRLNAVAKANGQTLSAEIVRRLEWTLNPDNGYDGGAQRSKEEERAVATMNALAVLPMLRRELNDFDKKLKAVTERLTKLDGIKG